MQEASTHFIFNMLTTYYMYVLYILWSGLFSLKYELNNF